jgi:hypothetical protein
LPWFAIPHPHDFQPVDYWSSNSFTSQLLGASVMVASIPGNEFSSPRFCAMYPKYAGMTVIPHRQSNEKSGTQLAHSILITMRFYAGIPFPDG